MGPSAGRSETTQWLRQKTAGPSVWPSVRKGMQPARGLKKSREHQSNSRLKDFRNTLRKNARGEGGECSESLGHGRFQKAPLFDTRGCPWQEGNYPETLSKAHSYALKSTGKKICLILGGASANPTRRYSEIKASMTCQCNETLALRQMKM